MPQKPYILTFYCPSSKQRTDEGAAIKYFKKTNNKTFLLPVVLSKPVSFLGYPSRFLNKCSQICYCIHFPVFSILRPDTELFLSYKMHMIITLFFRNPVYWIVPVETGELEKGTPVKLLGSFQRRLQHATQGHLITLILEDFWEAEADWWEVLMCDNWGKNVETPGFYFSLPNLKSCQQGSL